MQKEGALKKQEEGLECLKHDVDDCALLMMMAQKVDFGFVVDLSEKYLKVVLDAVVDFDFDFVEKKKIKLEILEMLHNFYSNQFVENKEQKLHCCCYYCYYYCLGICYYYS